MDASLRSAQRLLGRWVPSARVAVGAGPTLETLPGGTESPRLVAPRMVEGTALQRRRVPGEPTPGCTAFLDGIQRSRVVTYHDGVPIVHGTVAAVIRVRQGRRLNTHSTGPRVNRALYIPRALVPPRLWNDASAGPWPVVDTGEPMEGTTWGTSVSADPALAVHPEALAERAVHFVEVARQEAERMLAEQWCASEQSPLYVDGSVSGSDRVAASPWCFGVVKRHGTLYVAPDSLAVLSALSPGQRTTAFRITAARRVPVLSWYLRLRDAAGRDPTWGLVRVEVADTPAIDVGARADEVSRWVLAERAPVSLPDSRWDTMAYGIRDCEEFLRSIT